MAALIELAQTLSAAATQKHCSHVARVCPQKATTILLWWKADNRRFVLFLHFISLTLLTPPPICHEDPAHASCPAGTRRLFSLPSNRRRRISNDRPAGHAAHPFRFALRPGEALAKSESCVYRHKHAKQRHPWPHDQLRCSRG